jgi:membrane-associated phospholipid phosphatase
VQQQAPLLPDWPKNRPMAMPSADACGLAGPPEYSEAPGTAFHDQATEVLEVSRTLTDEQKAIARFWSDDPMLSPTPPGHWVSIILDIARRDELPADRLADALARLGIAVSDAFIACWQAKYQFDLVRPVTYIRRHIAPGFEPLLITPPFPEYPSGHSTQSGAAATVLTAILGDNFAFEDGTHVDDGLPVRQFASFSAAAEEAAISRLYGGIHFRAAIENGLAQGTCVGEFVNRLVTFK